MNVPIQVTLFARARDLAGTPTVTVSLPASACVGDLRNALAEQCPALRPHVQSLLIAVGQDYANDSTPLSGQQDIACFPPVSGG